MTTSRKQVRNLSLYRYDWELQLEEDLANATSKEVLDIIRTVKSWLVGYCESCGEYTDVCGGRVGCDCLSKGEWDK
jgi:hypothetical protein